ncbi:hypothetical protein Dda_5317 [Drechslerella dactyloides]|uniref:Uncharacterized protein n=1 Tax=Drechslerella dactyloides TaxID=74499 RepID=A0AAD6IVZ3_DREDA|nr:hypothetical protein Dda_5317 [Drechslerella dactyloides]
MSVDADDMMRMMRMRRGEKERNEKEGEEGEERESMMKCNCAECYDTKTSRRHCCCNSPLHVAAFDASPPLPASARPPGAK